MNFVTTVMNESKTYPGVVYVLKKMSEARRAQLRMAISSPTSKIRNLLREMSHLEELNPIETRSEDVDQKLLEMADQMEQISSDELNPRWLIWGLKSIEGLEIDGQPATPQSLIDDGPPTLFGEIVDEIKRIAQLNGGEEKNLKSPTTSGELTGGETTTISAVSASSGESSEPETATNISQS